jgi:hypothetical protein
VTYAGTKAIRPEIAGIETKLMQILSMPYAIAKAISQKTVDTKAKRNVNIVNNSIILKTNAKSSQPM